MRKRRSLLGGLFKFIFGLLLLLVVIVGTICGILYAKFKINVFDVMGQLKILSQQPQVEKIITNPYDENDKDAVIAIKNSTELLTAQIEFTDKQLAAYISDYIKENPDIIKVELSNNTTINLADYGFEVSQVKFSNIDENGNTDFNVVVKLELAKLKDLMNKNGIPLKWFTKKVPDQLYISSTVRVNKGTNAFEYTTEGLGLTINNLSDKDTESIFKTVNNFVKLGTAKEFSKIICDIFVDSLIGNNTNDGLAYSLKDIGAKDYTFLTRDDNNYFAIKIA